MALLIEKIAVCVRWYYQPDLNWCRRLERAASLPLDDGSIMCVNPLAPLLDVFLLAGFPPSYYGKDFKINRLAIYISAL